jgi:acetyl-CoA C-acetyltransferase
MREAVIVSYARTPIGKAYRGALKDTPGVTLAAHAITHALDRARIDPALVEDVVLACGMPEGSMGFNVARLAAIKAGIPASAAAMTINRFCSGGLQSIALAAQRILAGELDVAVAGGVESISLVQTKDNLAPPADPQLQAMKPGLWMSMLQTAEIVATRYGVAREAQDAMALTSQQRAAAAQAAGHLDAEIAPIAVQIRTEDAASGTVLQEERLVTRDEGIRPDTSPSGLANLKPVLEGGTVTAGNASQLSDGAAAVVVMEASVAERLGLTPLGRFRAFTVAGCEPDEMGIGPVVAVPRLLDRAGLTVSDIDLWEMNEAFAAQAVYCRDHLGIPDERLNIDGGGIALGHPYGMTGARLVGHSLLAARREGVKRTLVTMCVAGGMGAAALFEAA